MQPYSNIGLWEQSLAMLGDTVYLDIVRNFLGKIPTPFHKPLLTKRLAELFLNPEFQKQLLLRLSPMDRMLLSVIHVLGTPTQEEVCSLHSETLPYSTILNSLVNIEERLLVVPNPFASSGRREIMLNPLVKDLLISHELSYSAIFGESNDDGVQRYILSGADPNIVRALVSLHIHERLGNRERSNRLIRSKFSAMIFGFEDTRDIELLVAYNDLLFHKGVVSQFGKRVRVEVEMANSLLLSDPLVLQRLLFVSAWLGSFPPNEPSPLPEASLHKFFATMRIMLDTVPIASEEPLLFACKLAAATHRIPSNMVERLWSLLHQVGLSPSRMEGPHKSAHSVKPTIDTDLTISYSGVVPTVDGKDLLHILSIVRKVDVVSSYEITKGSIMRAFDFGYSVDDIVSYLRGLTHANLDGLVNLINHWKEEFSSISIYDGIVVKSDERHARIIGALPALQEHIIATIAPGIFLFSRKTEMVWREVLVATGIGYLPASIGIEEQEGEHKSSAMIVSSIGEEAPIDLAVFPLDPTAHDGDSERTLRNMIISKISNPTEREGLLSRLERKLILVPQQIFTALGPVQTMQASGFDYQGKMNLCKSAVNSQSDLLELHILDGNGERELLLAEAKEFIPSNEAPSLRVQTIPQGEERLIPLTALFKVRKLKRSVFFEL